MRDRQTNARYPRRSPLSVQNAPRRAIAAGSAQRCAKADTAADSMGISLCPGLLGENEEHEDYTYRGEYSFTSTTDLLTVCSACGQGHEREDRRDRGCSH